MSIKEGGYMKTFMKFLFVLLILLACDETSDKAERNKSQIIKANDNSFDHH